MFNKPARVLVPTLTMLYKDNSPTRWNVSMRCIDPLSVRSLNSLSAGVHTIDMVEQEMSYVMTIVHGILHRLVREGWRRGWKTRVRDEGVRLRKGDERSVGDDGGK